MLHPAGIDEMKSYFLEGSCSNREAIEALRRRLPGQEDPWLLRDESGDVVAYFYVFEDDQPDIRTPAIEVDISGRHYYSDSPVLEVLRSLQSQLGGDITENF